MRTFAGAEPEVLIRKLFLIDWRQLLCDCLLDYPVYYRGYPQLPYFALLLFGYFYPPDRVGFLFPFPHLFDQPGLVFSQVGHKSIHLHTVNSSSALVCFHFLIGGIKVVAPKNRV